MIVFLLLIALLVTTYFLLLLLENLFGICAGMVQQQLIATWTIRLVIYIVFYNNISSDVAALYGLKSLILLLRFVGRECDPGIVA